MNVKIQGGGNGTYANTGSCVAVTNYLQHEDLERMKKGEEVQPFFNQFRDYVSASYCRQWCTQLMGNSMYRFLSGGYEYLILLHGLFQLLDQIRCLAFVSFNVLCITVYDDIGNDQQQKNKSHQAAYLHK